MGSVVVGARIPQSLYDELQDLGKSQTELINESLKLYLDLQRNNNANGCKHGVNVFDTEEVYQSLKLIFNDYTGRLLADVWDFSKKQYDRKMTQEQVLPIVKTILDDFVENLCESLSDLEGVSIEE